MNKWAGGASNMSGLRGAGQGSADGTGGLDQRFRAALYSYFHRRVQDGQIADELTQEVFLRLSSTPGRGFGEMPEAHLFKIAGGVLQDWDRHCAMRCNSATTPLATVSETLGTPFVPLDQRARNLAIAARAALRELEDALSGLSKRTREIFLLSQVENVPHQEIASMHRISLACVDKHVLKAITHLSARAYKP